MNVSYGLVVGRPALAQLRPGEGDKCVEKRRREGVVRGKYHQLRELLRQGPFQKSCIYSYVNELSHKIYYIILPFSSF